MMHKINDLVALIYDRTYWSKNPTRAAIVNFSFYKNLTGLKALATLARDLYIPNLHAATRILSHKIFGKKVKSRTTNLPLSGARSSRWTRLPSSTSSR